MSINRTNFNQEDFYSARDKYDANLQQIQELYFMINGLTITLNATREKEYRNDLNEEINECNNEINELEEENRILKKTFGF